MGIQITQMAVLSRLLRPADFGLIGMALAVTGLVRLFSDVGLSTATVQRHNVDQEFVNAMFYIDLSISTLLMLLCWIVAPFAAIFFSEPRITAIIWIIAATFPVSALCSQHHALMARKMLLYRLSAITISSTALGAATAIVSVLFLNFGYWAIVAGAVATSLSNMLLSWILSPWRPNRVVSFAAGKSGVSFGLNLLGANLASWFWKQADNILIGYRWDAAELGYYARAYSLLTMPLSLVSGPIGGAVIPALCRLQDDKVQWKSLMFSSARIMAFFAGLLTLALAFNSEFIVHVLLGPDWPRSAKIFYYLTMSIFPSAVWEMSRFAFLSLGRADAMRRYAVAAAILHVSAFAIGVNFGAEGVAVSLAVASALVTPPLLIVCCRVSGMGLREFCAQLLPSFVALIAVWPLAELYGELVVADGSLAEALFKSAAISIAYVGIHILLMPWHAGWRRDAEFALRSARASYLWCISMAHRR